MALWGPRHRVLSHGKATQHTALTGLALMPEPWEQDSKDAEVSLSWKDH